MARFMPPVYDIRSLAEDESLNPMKKEFVKLVTFGFASLLGFADIGQAAILLDCNLSNGGQRFFLVNERNKSVGLVDTPDNQKCALRAEEHMFEWECAKISGRWASAGRVYRYTGEFELDWGTPPFGKYNLDNVFVTGTCTLSEGVRKF